MSNIEKDLATELKLRIDLHIEDETMNDLLRRAIAEIAQNARRLRALEMAMGEVEKDNAPKYSSMALGWIRLRADEIMREEGE